MKRFLLFVTLAAGSAAFTGCHLFAGSAAEMCRERMKEKRACHDLFLLEYGKCNGESTCQQNAMSLSIGCASIPTDSCGKRGGGGPGGR